ncbi:type II toxin-antitoxin system VapC family toxin [Kytococcus sedentarius]|uniref:Ribonuclease VapC n=1 Tax=Kytococcus sedentarius (strain ATCC 14392 / DSM 20547 / JCM 11482 / CCUG 33030 / NBRC 15357 / NCTC 11040 / CCM 314 / 541) TaxID=478801 RepID=C7NGG0_KYTSD|nr:type II toxin-antitoxin system VapC family toxin [Kytococcus sedentarius]ACV06068.1 PIN domain-containing protein [Kytococcus sedentarius DSM 20547]QQB64436.1 type II toxin-antitoxin system VapC family toxin [Kytococcus sedentarius]STX12513.1 Predicted nucleic acid-binding protein, contains PIN domain [Kytococcus sedentarius]
MILDANVVIALLNPEDAHHSRAAGLLVEVPEEDLHIPAVTLGEALVWHVRAGTGERALEVLEDLGLSVIESQEDPLELARVRAESGLRMPDCIVLHHALTRGEALATMDERLARAGLERGLRALPRPRG